MVYSSRLFPSKLTRNCEGLPQLCYLLLGFLDAFLGDPRVEMRVYIGTRESGSRDRGGCLAD